MITVLFATDMASDTAYSVEASDEGLFIIASCFEDDSLVGSALYGPLVCVSEEEATQLRLDLWGDAFTPFQDGEVFEAIIDNVQIIFTMVRGAFYRGIEIEEA